MENDMSVFKSYLRSLMRDLKDLQEAIKKKIWRKLKNLLKI